MSKVSEIIKEGSLFKQRDFVKGWRSRHFVLQDTFLQYYLDIDDAIPRNSLDVTGCSVESGTPTKVNGIEYFPFIITNSIATKSGDSYKLASDSILETEDWVDKIRMAATNATFHNENTSKELEDDKVDNNTTFSDNVVTGEANVTMSFVNPTETKLNIPDEFSSSIEKAVSAMLSAVQPSASGWEPIFEKKGVTARKRPGGVICVRGDSLLPFSLGEIFCMIQNAEHFADINPQIGSSKVIKTYSSNTYVQYIKFKQIWPTAARDFLNITHWRLLGDNRIVIISFRDRHTKFAEIDGVVRGDLILGGYVLTPSPQGTLVQYLVQSDLKGTIPSSVVTFVSYTQPMIVANLRKILEDNQKKNNTPECLFQAITWTELKQLRDKNNKPDASEEDKAVVGGGDDKRKQLSRSSSSRQSASAKDINEAKRRSDMKRGVTTGSLLILLLPPVASYVVPYNFRSLAFFIGLIVACASLIRRHLGEPVRRQSAQDNTSMASGRLVVRFPVDLGKLLSFITNKREQSSKDGNNSLEFTLTHVCIKSAAMVLNEMSGLNGYVIFNNFYRKKTSGVDVSVSVDTTEKDSVMVKIENADLKPLDYIADELQKKSKLLRKPKSELPPPSSFAEKKAKLFSILPLPIVLQLEGFLKFLGVSLGIDLPDFGINRFPLGVCTVITSPNREGDADVDIALIPHMTDSSTPITITIGGIRVLPTFDSERKLAAAPVLNIAVSIDTKSCSLVEGRRFCAKLQSYLNSPNSIEKSKSVAPVQKKK
jgi:hypothetical protein